MTERRQELQKPIPVPTQVSREYWAAAARGELVLQWCGSCESWVHYPRLRCPSCGSNELTFRRVSGRGVIYSHTTIQTAGGFPSYADRIPYTVVVVELDEGPRIVSNLLDAGSSGARIGDPVEVTFEKRGPTTLPQFRPVT